MVSMQRQAADKSHECQLRLGHGTQEVARLHTDIGNLRARLDALQSQIAADGYAVSRIAATRRHETDRFGIFADAAQIMPKIEALAVNVEAVHDLDPESRRFAIMRLGERFDELRAVARLVRTVTALSATFYNTLDLSDTLEAINMAAAELMECTQVCALMRSHLTAIRLRTGAAQVHA
jgi:hypothetical protein